MGYLKGILSFFRVLETIFRMIHDKEMRQMGYKKAKEEVEKTRSKIKEISDEVDKQPVADSVDKLHNGL